MTAPPPQRLDDVYDVLREHRHQSNAYRIFRQEDSCDLFIHEPLFCHVRIQEGETGYLLKAWFLPRSTPEDTAPLLLELEALDTRPIEDMIPYSIFTAAYRNQNWFPIILQHRLKDLRIEWFSTHLPSTVTLLQGEEYEGYMHFTGEHEGRVFTLSTYDEEIFIGYEPELTEVREVTTFPDKYFNISTPVYLKDPTSNEVVPLLRPQDLDGRRLGLLLSKALDHLNEVSEFAVLYLLKHPGREGYEVSKGSADDPIDLQCWLKNEWGIDCGDEEVVAGIVTGAWIL